MTKKQNDIFETAKRLFYKFGVKKVTIKEICEEANVSKMTFYKYFPNKIELAKAVIDNYYSFALRKYEAMMQSDIPAEEKIRLTFELKLDNASDLDIEFVSELYKYPDNTIRALLEVWKQRSIDITKKWFITTGKSRISTIFLTGNTNSTTSQSIPSLIGIPNKSGYPHKWAPPNVSQAKVFN